MKKKPPNISDSTRTVSGTVLARNNVGSLRSRNIFCSGARTCDSPYRKLVCGPWGRWGVVRERVRTADERRSVPNTCSLQPTGREWGDQPSIHATANDPGIPRTGHGYGSVAVLATHEAIPSTAAVVVGLNREDAEWAKYRSNNKGL